MQRGCSERDSGDTNPLLGRSAPSPEMESRGRKLAQECLVFGIYVQRQRSPKAGGQLRGSLIAKGKIRDGRAPMSRALDWKTQ